MMALQKVGQHPGLQLVDVDPPAIAAPDDVIVEVAAAGICGSDLHIDKWIPDYAFLIPALPVTLGHEFSGRIHAAGPAVEPGAVGRRVVVKPSVACGRCRHCREGDPDDCRSRTPIGLLQNGAFARYVRAPFAQCIGIPDSLGLDLAALVEPLTISEHAVQDGEVQPGQRVVVFGPGTIGQGAAILARIAGAAEVVVVGHGDKHRFETLKALGFDTVIDLAEPDGEARLRKMAGDGFDVAIEAAGVGPAFLLGLETLRPRGILVAVGIHGLPATFDMNHLVRRRLQIRGSYRATHEMWTKVIGLLDANPAAFAPMITHRLPLEQALEGIALGHSRVASKVILQPGAVVR